MGVRIPSGALLRCLRTQEWRELTIAVRVFLEGRVGYGTDDYDVETCWLDYRFEMLQIPLIIIWYSGFRLSRSPNRGARMAQAVRRVID